MIKKIVLTGGPCGGKTTTISYIKDYCANNNIRLLVVPEVATLLSNGGLDLNPQLNSDKVHLQYNLLNSILALESSFDISSNLKTLIVCDRGACDAKAFVSDEIWNEVLSLADKTEGELKSRYDAILHLTSCAVDAPQFYTTSNNPARTESIEQAAIIDRNILSAWLGHPHLRIFPNVPLNIKINNVISEISNLMSDNPIEKERKFLVKIPDLSGINSIPSTIIQDYLISEHTERVRMRTSQNYTCYYHTIKKTQSTDLIELERRISLEEYLSLLSRKDHECTQIIKTRHCFVYHDNYFECDVFDGNLSGLAILEVEESCNPLILPPSIPIIKEVTGDKSYSNLALSKLH